VDASIKNLKKMTEIIKTLPEKATRIENLVYIPAFKDEPIGAIANLILDALGVNVGLCYKTKASRANVSIRSRRGLPFHLGIITRKIAAKHGGFGGGHKRASGASIPNEYLNDFINSLIVELK
jgi:nanoRNase/pAp phosphatase (c-di-AMP/oligoRNAs hydrolase)